MSAQRYSQVDPVNLEMQRRYSQQFTGDVESPSSPTHPRICSSADLYALDDHGRAPPNTNRRSSALLSGTWNDGDSSDENEDGGGPGFSSYANDETRRTSRRMSGAPSVALSQGRRSRMSLQAPPLIQSVSQGSLPPADQFSSYGKHSSMGSLGAYGNKHSSMGSLGPYGLPYSGSFATPSSASFAKLPATAAAADTVEAPILSKQDWSKGEAIREKNTNKSNKVRAKREKVTGGVAGVAHWIGERWKIFLPLLIFLSVASILLCYFLIPRTPTITFTSTKVPANPFTSTDTNPFVQSADPTSFSFGASLTFALDASASYLPVTYKSFGLTVALTDTGGVVSKTVWDNSEIKIKAKGVTSYEFPITFSGNYSSSSDRTYTAIRSACAHKYATVYRPPLNLTVTVDAAIVGVINPPTRVAKISNLDCPVEWSSSAA